MTFSRSSALRPSMSSLTPGHATRCTRSRSCGGSAAARSRSIPSRCTLSGRRSVSRRRDSRTGSRSRKRRSSRFRSTMSPSTTSGAATCSITSSSDEPCPNANACSGPADRCSSTRRSRPPRASRRRRGVCSMRPPPSLRTCRQRSSRDPRAKPDSRSSAANSSTASGGSGCWRTRDGTSPPICWRSLACTGASPPYSSTTDARRSRRSVATFCGASTSCSGRPVQRSTSSSFVRSVIAPNLLELVGNTPLVELRPVGHVRIYAKLEGQNPTGSIKDRIAKAMIEAAEASGGLEPGRALLEPTSGNTGISLALVAKLKGYPLTCVMPENATEERKRLLGLFGANIVFSPGEEGSNGAVRLALELAEREPGYFMPFQYANEANPRAHYEGTGTEIADALDRVDVLVAGLGTGGTLMGAGDRLRESFPAVVVAAAEPLPGDPVMGLRSLDEGYVPPILDVDRLDRKLLVSNEEAVVGVRALLEREGIFAGVSSGAVLHVTQRLAGELEEGTVVCVLADGGWKYLSAGFWQGEELDESKLWW